MPVMETLYKTNAPEELERAEYYQPRIEQKVLCGKWAFFVTEKHAWYDDRGKQVFAPGFTLDPKEEEGYPSLEAAKLGTTSRSNIELQKDSSTRFTSSSTT